MAEVGSEGDSLLATVAAQKADNDHYRRDRAESGLRFARKSLGFQFARGRAHSRLLSLQAAGHDIRGAHSIVSSALTTNLVSHRPSNRGKARRVVGRPLQRA